MDLFELFKEPKDKLHRQELSELKFLEALKEQCRNAYGVIKTSPIYCKQSGPDMMLVDPEAKEEKSSFWIDKLTKRVKGWQRFPSRSRALRGFTTLERVGSGEDVYVVIPLDKSRVGVCPGKSFYRSFEAISDTFNIERLDNPGLCTWLKNLSEGLMAVSDAKLKTSDPQTFMEFMSRVDDIEKALKDKNEIRRNMKSASMSDEARKAVQDLLDRHITDVSSYMEEKLDPEYNGFKVVPIESFHSGHQEKEVWVDHPCLLIRRSKYIDMHKKGTVK